MTIRRDTHWMAKVKRFGITSLLKLILAVFSVLYLVLLLSYLPGVERLAADLLIPFDALISAVLTAAILVLFYRIATQARDLIHGIETAATDEQALTAGVAYWGVILLSIPIAYVSFGPAARPVFGYANFEVFYPLFFAILAIIPLVFLLVELGIFIRAQRRPTPEEPPALSEIQPVEEQVYQVLNAHGGIAPQGELSTATGWSKSKTSRILSEMEDGGWIVRYQVGREKIVCLPGNEPRFVSTAT